MNLISKIKENYQIVLIVLFFLLFIKQCSINRDVDKLSKSNFIQTEQIEQIKESVNSIEIVDLNEIRYEMDQVMFNFLIYEDDLDKGKLSLSDIRNKIEPNE